MERKKLIGIGVQGPAIRIPQSHRVTEVRGPDDNFALLLGVDVRDETDIEDALVLALTNSTPDRRMAVKEFDVELRGDQPEFSWREVFESDLAAIQEGDVLVETPIAKIYERRFLFESVRDGGREMYFLRGERRRPMRIRGLTPDYTEIVGRTDELRRLEELVEQASVDQGQIVSLVGEAGIGKTRLKVAFRDFLAKREVACLEGTHSPHQTSRFEGVRQVVVSLVGSSIDTLSRWEMTDAETDFLRLLLDPGVQIDRLQGLSEKELRDGLFFSVRKLIHSAAKTPLVLILEDLHWADESSRDLVEFVLEDLEPTRALIVLLHRPDIPAPWARRLNFTEIRLKPLNETEIEAVGKGLLSVDRISPAAVRDLVRQSIGNPLYVEEMLRQWRDSGVLEIELGDDGERVARRAATEARAVPSTLRALISTRLDRLEPVKRDVLSWACLFGAQFDADEFIAFLGHIQIPEAERRLLELIELSYLLEASAFPKRLLRFKHDLIFELVRESLSADGQRERHSRIGRFLNARHPSATGPTLDRIADHLLRGTQDAEMFVVVMRAANAASASHRYASSLRFFRAASACWKKLPDKPMPAHAVFVPYVRTAVTVGEGTEAAQALADWSAAGMDDSDRARALLQRCRMLHEDLTGQWGRALEASDIALPLLHAIPELQEEYYEAVHDRANLLMQTGRIRELVHEAFVALRSLNDGRFPVTRMRLWARAAFGPLTAGHSAQALSFIERARALIDDDTPIPIQIEILSRAVPIYERLGRFTDSLRLGTQRIEMARTNGLRQKLALALMHRGITAEEMGDYVVALADYREAVKLAKEIGDVSTYNRSQLGIFDTYLDLGSIGAARAWWKEYGSFFLSPENRWHRGSIRNMRSYFMELEGHYGEAVRERKEAVTVNTEVGLHAASARSALHVIRMQSLYRLSPMDQVSREYGALAQRIVRKSWTDADFQLRGVGLTVEACGGTVPPETSLEEPPARCPIAWLRQEVYVAKIRWLRAKGRAEEAEALREGYRRERAKIAERVPPEYLADFMNHPLYRVPE